MNFTYREPYLQYSLALRPEEEALCADFGAWLPREIIDCHAHSNLMEHVESMEEKTYGHMLSTFPFYSIRESQQIKQMFFPLQTTKTLRFAKTFRGINHRKANEYLLDNSPSEDRVALFGLPEDIGYTNKMLGHRHVSALKMYYSYVEPTATTIYGFFKPEILAKAEELGKPIILHPPKVITACHEDLRQTLRDFPRLKISIAHLGLSKFLIEGLKEVFEEFCQHDNIMLDTALNPSKEVVELALRVFGPDRIMFGSDEPLHLIRSRPFQHPDKGQRIITEYKYHWVDDEDHRRFSHLADGVIHAHWLSMNALRDAISTFPTSEQESIKKKVFCENAKKFFGF